VLFHLGSVEPNYREHPIIANCQQLIAFHQMHGHWALNLLWLGFQLSQELLVLIIIDDYQAVVRRAGYQIIALADNAGDFAASVDLGPPYYLFIFQVEVLDDTILSTETEDGMRINRCVYFRYSCDLVSVSV